MIYAAILAGGSGSRFGSALPKQFLPVDGEPIVIRSLRVFDAAPDVDDIRLCVPGAYLDFAARMLADYGLDGRVSLVAGGANRNESLKNVLAALPPAQDGDLILTHDAVRPFIDARIIRENLEAAARYGACTTAEPAVDTIMIADENGLVASVPPRDRVRHVQTPQTFCLKTLRELYDGMSERELAEYTDACTVFVMHGLPVALVRGSRENIKITYPEDIQPKGAAPE